MCARAVGATPPVARSGRDARVGRFCESVEQAASAAIGLLPYKWQEVVSHATRLQIRPGACLGRGP